MTLFIIWCVISRTMSSLLCGFEQCHARSANAFRIFRIWCVISRTMSSLLCGFEQCHARSANAFRIFRIWCIISCTMFASLEVLFVCEQCHASSSNLSVCPEDLAHVTSSPSLDIPTANGNVSLMSQARKMNDTCMPHQIFFSQSLYDERVR
jgi:hypothetical protein